MTIYTFGLAARGGRLTSIWGFSQMLNRAKPYGPVDFRGSAAYADVAQAMADAKRLNKEAKLVLAGYSLGAANAVSVAYGLKAVGFPVDLLFLVVPPKATVPANVKRCVCHTIAGGWFLSPAWSSDIISRESHATDAVNYDYGSVLGLSHVAIQAFPAVHQSFAAELKRLESVE